MQFEYCICVRVSTVDQHLERQVKALEVYRIDKWFSEKVSGKNTDRPKLKEMLEFVREGDTIYVMDWSRLSRSTVDLLRIIEGLARKKVKLVSIKENFDTSTPTGRLMLNLIASINEFERQNLLERQREGIEIAKNQGKYKGRQPNKYNEEKLRAVITGIANKTITVTEASRRLGVTRATIYNILKKYNMKGS
ncbi:MAG: recombinase family protein [Oscillospiraceae bacterium]|nr:recombinase family protein [Oscillospiraceae bacterium]